MKKRLVLVLLATVVGIVACELLLQLAYGVVWVLHATRANPSRADERPLVLCLGDSFTYGMGASSPEASYPARLETLLRTESPPFRVENRGWPGRNSRDVLAGLDALLASHRPSVVCITVGVNDAWSHPDRLELPPDLVVPAAHASGEDYVWTLRVWRLLQTFRSLDPFRDPAPLAVGSRQPATLVGAWHTADDGLKVVFEPDGRGRFGDTEVKWSADDSSLRVELPGAPVIPGAWQLTAGTLSVRILERDVELLRDDHPLPPPGPAAEGYRAMQMGDWATALAAFRTSLQSTPARDPELPKLRAALAQCLCALGQREAALAELATIRNHAAEHDDFVSMEALASALSAMGFEDEAAAVVETAIARGARTPGLWLQFALQSEKAGDLARARRAIDTAIEDAAAKHGGFAILHRTKARLLNASNDLDEFALAALDGHLQDHRDEATRQLLIGWRAPQELRTDAVRKACAVRGLASGETEHLLQLLAESLGTANAVWQTTLVDHLRQAIRRCRKVGARPILGTYPFQFAARWAVQALAKEEGVPWVEVDTHFAALQQKEPGRVLTVADGHCNDDGYAEMAQCFARVVRALPPLASPR